ncbi:MAG: DUF1501 domain-containing protein [Planctomycetaceae bacterium]
MSSRRSPADSIVAMMTRRESLLVGGLSYLGLSALDLKRARAAVAESSAAQRHRRNSCVFIFLFGGPSHIDLWDMKPEAPLDVRGEFQSVDSRVPGIHLAEHLPMLAQQTDKLCLLRSMHHEDPVHGTACSQMISGRPHRRPGTTDTLAPDDWPSISSLVMRYGRANGGLPASIVVPWYLMFPSQGKRIAGQTGGLMGEQHNAFLVEGDPSDPAFEVPGLKLPDDVPSERVGRRMTLLERLDSPSRGVQGGRLGELMSGNYETAFAMLGGRRIAQSFELSREPVKVRERYGHHKFAQSLLLARRLIETGTSLVTVNWDDPTRDEKQSPFWDTHHDNFGRLKNHLVPPFDRAFSAFLEDLAQRGLLETTLVCVMGEFGRTPKIGRIVQNGMTEKTGRDHWPHAFTVLLAGGGVRGGQIYGSSDKQGGYVKESPVTPRDLAATIFYHLGIDFRSEYQAPIFDEHYRLSIGVPIPGLG